MMYTIRWARDAAAFYDGLTDDERARVDLALFQLSSDPVAGAHAKKLLGPLAGLRSARAGRGIRLIYQFDPTRRIIDLLVLANRRDAY